MTVSELIALLETQPQHLTVVYRRCSEAVTLDHDDIVVEERCKHRPDGWCPDVRSDSPTQTYLVLPGN